VSTIEELSERKSSGSGLGNQEYRRRDQSTKVGTDLPTSGCRSVGVVLSRIQATEFSMLSSFIEVIGRPQGRSPLTHGHHENAYVIHQPAVSSLPTYNTFVLPLLVSLEEICLAERKISCLRGHFQMR
jgi:hypothetical protein